MKRSRFFWLVYGFSFLVFMGGVQAQEKYPNRTIELVCPYGTGGSNDMSVRIYSDKLGQVLKVPVTVVNLEGGTGIRGALYVVRAKKDGYTLLAAGQTPLTVNPLISKEATYDPLKDLFPLGHLGAVPVLFVVRSDSPIKTFGDLVEYARKNPGMLKNAAGGLTTASQFNLEVLCSQNNIKINSIPFKSGGDAMVALLGGHVDMTSGSLIVLAPQIKAGKLRGLAMVSKKRDPSFPDIPTTAELGYPYLNLVQWVSISAPAGVPKSVLDVLIPAVEKVFKDPEVIDRAAKLSIVADYMGPDEFGKFIAEELRVIGKIVKNLGLSVK